MLGFFVSLLVVVQAYAAFPLALHGARARWDSGETVTYYPNPWLNPSGLRAEALQLESGERLAFTIQGQQDGAWRLSPGKDWKPLSEWVKEPAVLVVSDWTGQEIDRTYFQTGALLDSLYRYEGCLGVCWKQGQPELRVWAPTARAVRVIWVSSERAQDLKPVGEGVWAIAGDASWRGRRYLYEVEVFTPSTGRVERQRVTDPYSVALTENSRASFVFDPEDPSWMPSGWNQERSPPLSSRHGAVLYELHLREFSQGDFSVPAELRGTYRAVTLEESTGARHLARLAEAGITHVHFLPVQDFTSVDENRRSWIEPQVPRSLPPDSPVPQQEVERARSVDGFNWGYDPFHFFAPDGSYSAEPDSPLRVKEFRELVQAMHRRGLRVVIDVVFNHTFASGLSRESVLDRIVPGYYYRLDRDGMVRNTSCCSDTASERWMMEKLMGDALVSWRRVFHVDGFRFDLMNLHGVSTMARLRDRLRRQDPSLLFYGEAWPFGSLAERSPEAFTQDKAYGQRIGVFNDRLRDAARGGTTDTKEKSDQGFLTGLFYDFNHEPANKNTPVDLGAQREKLLYLSDIVRLGLAGNLRDFGFRGYQGRWVTGGSLYFHGSPAGFAESPEETVNYISAHDGYTLFDALQAKLPFYSRWRDPATASLQERVDRQILGLGLVALSQGMPFFDAGSEILRSKSGDQNSYDSGDWFNQLDWSGQENGWGRGLPPQHSNPGDWPFWRPRLAESSLKPGPKEIAATQEAFLALLRLRRGSPLFRLDSGAEIQSRLSFLETDLGPMQPPGLIVMEIRDDEGRNLDPRWRRLIVAFNVTNETSVFSHERLRGRAFERLYGTGEVRPFRETQLSLPARSLSVWGEPE